MTQNNVRFEYLLKKFSGHYVPKDIVDRFLKSQYLYVYSTNQKLAKFHSLEEVITFLDNIATKAPRLIEDLYDLSVVTYVYMEKQNQLIFPLIKENIKELRTKGHKLDAIEKEIDARIKTLDEEYQRDSYKDSYVNKEIIKPLLDKLKPVVANDPLNTPVASK